MRAYSYFNQVGDSEGKQSARDVLSQLQAVENKAQDTGKAVRPTGEGSLTQREVEVLGLIAEGLTNSQIAERLVLSSRTVQAHVRSIYSKLGIASRSAATRYAIGHNLG